MDKVENIRETILNMIKLSNNDSSSFPKRGRYKLIIHKNDIPFAKEAIKNIHEKIEICEAL